MTYNLDTPNDETKDGPKHMYVPFSTVQTLWTIFIGHICLGPSICLAIFFEYFC